MTNNFIIQCRGQKVDPNLIGNKAYNLNKLFSDGVKMPQTFFVNTTLFDTIKKEVLSNDLFTILDIPECKLKAHVQILQNKIKSYKNTKRLSEELKTIKKLFSNKQLAVRSSSVMEDTAQSSWAGQHASFLNVGTNNLENKILECIASVFSFEAVKYGMINGIDIKNYKIGVIIQEMVKSVSSGVLFSCHPTEKNCDTVLIESAFGLGEAIVSGLINVDSFVVNKKDGKLLKKNISNKSKGLFFIDKINQWRYFNEIEANSPSLLDRQISILFKTALKIENSFGFYIDIEWAFDKNELFILQVRPISIRPKERLMVSHQSDLLTQDLVLSGVFKHCKFKKYGLSFDFPDIRYEHSTGDIFYPEHQVAEFENLVLSIEKYEEIANTLKDELDEYKSFLTEFEDKVSSNNTVAQTVIELFFEKSLLAVSTIPYFICFEITLNKALLKEEILPNEITSSETETKKAALCLSSIRTKYKHELEYINKSNLVITKELEIELHKFCNKYGFLGMLYFKGRPWTIIDALKMLINKVQLNENFKINKGKTSNNRLLIVAEKLLKYRTIKWELMCYGCYLFRQFFITRFNDIIDYNEILNYRIEDVINITKRQYLLNENFKRSFVLKITNTRVELFEEEVKSFENNLKYTNNIYKGTIANRGIVIGRARVVLSPDSKMTFNEGDILVTKMSTPDFLPILEKASALVTEIGGITSHAAIVSRELGKPCLIGVKDITKLIDNLMVEVDCEIGSIRILNI